MNKYLKWTLIGVATLVVLLFVAYQTMLNYTKSHSPQETVVYEQADLRLAVDYSRPYKKERDIFGELVPYSEVWRTGANEPTLFSTSQSLQIDGQPLPAGTYTLWTIPNQDQWTVLFNDQEYGWGINFDGTSPYDPTADIVSVKSTVEDVTTPIEQFTIRFTKSPLAMVIEWDDTRVSVPINR